MELRQGGGGRRQPVEEEAQTEELSGLGTMRVCSGRHPLSLCQPGVNNLSSAARTVCDGSDGSRLFAHAPRVFSLLLRD